jgi:hypothetical protein
MLLFKLNPLIGCANPSAPQSIRRPAYSNPSEPIARMISVHNLIQMTVKLQESILRNLFCKSTVARHAQGNREDH